AVPSAAAITAMDQALGWVELIPADKFVLRRIVNARSLVSPSTGRHLFTWSAIARLIGADRKAVVRWHGQGIALIAAGLRVDVFGLRPPPGRRMRPGTWSLPCPNSASPRPIVLRAMTVTVDTARMPPRPAAWASLAAWQTETGTRRWQLSRPVAPSPHLLAD